MSRVQQWLRDRRQYRCFVAEISRMPQAERQLVLTRARMLVRITEQLGGPAPALARARRLRDLAAESVISSYTRRRTDGPRQGIW